MKSGNNNDINNDIGKNVVEFMRARRSVPAKLMSGPGPDDTQLRKILEIACRVPDHGKLTPWRLMRYSHDKCVNLGERILARALQRAVADNRVLNEEEIEIERHRFLRTPVVIAIVSCAKPHPKIPEWEQILSSGAVATNMLIAANANGFDAQWLTEWYAYDDALRGDLRLEENERVTGFIHIGTKLHPKTERNRPCLDEIYTLIGI